MSEHDRGEVRREVVSLYGSLTELLTAQWQLQRESFKIDPVSLVGRERIDYITWNILALEDELHEALNEISWKPWTSGEVFNREEFVGEMADAFHFFLNILLAAAPSTDYVVTREEMVYAIVSEFVGRYHRKRKVNADRQNNGYDGFSDKCECGRAMEDGKFIEEYRPGHKKHYRCVCGVMNTVPTAHAFHPDDQRCIDCGKTEEELAR